MSDGVAELGTFDVAVVGAGIVGLAHALAAARLGARVIVLDRDARAAGASVRNFGFVTVTGQAAGEMWKWARRSRDVWVEVAEGAVIAVVHRNLVVLARTPEGAEVLREFASLAEGSECALLGADDTVERVPMARREGLLAGLWSPHEVRVEPRDAIPRLAAWLESRWGVRFVRSCAVRSVDPPVLQTSAGTVRAEHAVVCPGNDLLSLFPEVAARHATTHCKLHMVRVAPQASGWRLPAAVMTDLSFVRYPGYTPLGAVAELRSRLERTHADALEAGVHLIVVQSSDGSLVVGDSHVYEETPDPFQPGAVDDIMLRVLHETLDVPVPDVVERWIGVYPASPVTETVVATPQPHIRVVLVTSGTGMSVSFGLAEEVVADLLGAAAS